MGYSTESTEWPNFGVASATKDLIDYFFSLLDDPNENVGDKLADEIFTADGSIVAIGLTASGTAGEIDSVMAKKHLRVITSRTTEMPRECLEGGH